MAVIIYVNYTGLFCLVTGVLNTICSVWLLLRVEDPIQDRADFVVYAWVMSELLFMVDWFLTEDSRIYSSVTLNIFTIVFVARLFQAIRAEITRRERS
jgi:hypothetical protein